MQEGRGVMRAGSYLRSSLASTLPWDRRRRSRARVTRGLPCAGSPSRSEPTSALAGGASHVVVAVGPRGRVRLLVVASITSRCSWLYENPSENAPRNAGNLHISRGQKDCT